LEEKIPTYSRVLYIPGPWLVVSTHLKNSSQIASFPQVRVKIENIWNHDPVSYILSVECRSLKNQQYLHPFPPVFAQQPQKITAAIGLYWINGTATSPQESSATTVLKSSKLAFMTFGKDFFLTKMLNLYIISKRP